MFNIFFFRFYIPFFFLAITEYLIPSQGDMGEDGPKGDLGEKVRKFTFPTLGTCTETQQGLAVAGKHKKKEKKKKLMLAI